MLYNSELIFKRIEDKLQPKDLFFGKTKFELDFSDNNSFQDYLFCNDYNIVCWHMTRLTEKEIEDVKKNGIKADCSGKDFFICKIKELPDSCNCIKKDLLNYINNIRFTQSEGNVCASFGPIPEDNTEQRYFIFTENWGGETIYNYYDNNQRPLPPENQRIKDILAKASVPCMVFLKIKFRTICENEKVNYLCFQNTENMTEYEKQSFIEEKSFNLYRPPEEYEVIDIVELC